MTDAAASGSEGVPSSEFAGVPDGFQRLWTPHRMAYIQAGADAMRAACPFCADGAAKGTRGHWFYECPRVAEIGDGGDDAPLAAMSEQQLRTKQRMQARCQVGAAFSCKAKKGSFLKTVALKVCSCAVQTRHEI